MTVPAWVLADLVKDTAPSTSAALNKFDYPPVGAVTVAYPVSAVRDDRKAADGSVPGFGQLHPRSQVRRGRGEGLENVRVLGRRVLEGLELHCIAVALGCSAVKLLNLGISMRVAGADVSLPGFRP